MNPQIIIAAVIAAASFGAAWRVQDWRADAKEKAHAESKLAQVQHSAAASIRRSDNVIEAQNQSAARSAALRRDLDGARTELDRLRIALARPVPGTSATGDACTVPADPARQLLADCAAELVEMGVVADRHASDSLMLQQAWPK